MYLFLPRPGKFNLGFAVFDDNKGRGREIPLDTRGFQTFLTEWGLGRVRTTSDTGSAPRYAGTGRKVDLSVGKVHMQWNRPLEMTRVLDINDNTAYSGWEVTLTDDGREVLQSAATLPSGQVYTEEVPLAQASDEDDSSSVVSVSSNPSSDGDGHSECAGEEYCQDDAYFERERGDLEDTVTYVFNTNQRLFPEGKASEDKSSGFSNSERSTTEDGF